jgi:hypothetical protein
MRTVFTELEDAASAGADCSTLGEVWTKFSLALRNHLKTEEDSLFPVFRHRHPVELAALVAEHDHIRTQLDQLDIEVDLHVVRNPVVRALIADLDAHARREDLGLYTWADVELSSAEQRRVLDRLYACAQAQPPYGTAAMKSPYPLLT